MLSGMSLQPVNTITPLRLRLGWLIAPKVQTIWVYAPNRRPESKVAPATLTAAPLLPGFALSLAPIWNPGL